MRFQGSGIMGSFVNLVLRCFLEALKGRVSLGHGVGVRGGDLCCALVCNSRRD